MTREQTAALEWAISELNEIGVLGSELRHMDELCRLRAALSAPKAEAVGTLAWRDIDTAPMGESADPSTYFIGARQSGDRISVATCYRNKHGAYEWWGGGMSPTHWMPLKPLSDTSPVPALTDEAVTEAARDVLAERARQISVEGWSQEHDDSEHRSGQLAIAAACYAISGGGDNQVRHLLAGKRWTLYEANLPVTAFYWLWSLTIKWSPDWFKPSSRRRDLVKAGALILAEIERLDRAALLAAFPSKGEGD